MRPTGSNGKGDSPRNCFSQKFRDNHNSINWKKKESKKDSTKPLKTLRIDKEGKI
jgi:hypothetical protein